MSRASKTAVFIGLCFLGVAERGIVQHVLNIESRLQNTRCSPRLNLRVTFFFANRSDMIGRRRMVRWSYERLWQFMGCHSLRSHALGCFVAHFHSSEQRCASVPIDGIDIGA